jgi:hypothetical protein
MDGVVSLAVALALRMLDVAASLLTEVATFESVGVSKRIGGRGGGA